MTPTIADATEAPPAEPAAGVNRWLTPPTFEEAHTEWLRYWATPMEVIDPDRSHYGQYVAFFDGKPWGYDHNPTALMERFFAAMDVHPNWVQFAYLG